VKVLRGHFEKFSVAKRLPEVLHYPHDVGQVHWSKILNGFELEEFGNKHLDTLFRPQVRRLFNPVFRDLTKVDRRPHYVLCVSKLIDLP